MNYERVVLMEIENLQKSSSRRSYWLDQDSESLAAEFQTEFSTDLPVGSRHPVRMIKTASSLHSVKDNIPPVQGSFAPALEHDS